MKWLKPWMFATLALAGAGCGGVEPESVDRVRVDAPEAFRVQQRAVTEADYSEVAQRHPEVQRVIEDAIARISRAGKAAGILTTDEAQARRYLQLGALFVAVGLDNNLLAKASSALAAKFKSAQPAPAAPSGGNPY